MDTNNGYLGLVAAVIRSGLKDESPKYPLTKDGRYWCGLGNINPEYVSLRAFTLFPVKGGEKLYQ